MSKVIRRRARQDIPEGSILHKVFRPDRPIMINPQPLRDVGLSYAATGLYAKLSAIEDEDFSCTVENVVSMFGGDSEIVSSLIDELLVAGWLLLEDGEIMLY